MFTLKELILAINRGDIRVTDHADEEAQNDRLTYKEIFSSVANGEIIEEYPSDKPYPSCLVYGESDNNEPIHSVWAYNMNTRFAVLITVYRPHPKKWVDWKVRRKP